MTQLRVGDVIAWGILDHQNLFWKITSIDQFTGACTLDSYEKTLTPVGYRLLHTDIETDIRVLNARILGGSMVILDLPTKIEIET